MAVGRFLGPVGGHRPMCKLAALTGLEGLIATKPKHYEKGMKLGEISGGTLRGIGEREWVDEINIHRVNVWNYQIIEYY